MQLYTCKVVGPHAFPMKSSACHAAVIPTLLGWTQAAIARLCCLHAFRADVVTGHNPSWSLNETQCLVPGEAVPAAQSKPALNADVPSPAPA